MPTARHLPAVAAARAPFGGSGTFIYAIDGDNGTRLNTNEAYNPNKNNWTTLVPDPTPRSGSGAAAAPCPGGTLPAGCIYVEGGFNGSGQLGTNEAFSTFTNSWLTLTPDPIARAGEAVAAARCPFNQGGTCIYGFGGLHGAFLTTAEAFNVNSNDWTTVMPMPAPRGLMGAAAAPCPGGTVPAGCVYLVDGFHGSVLGVVEVYNTFTNTWLTETPDPTSRANLAVVAARAPFGGSGMRIYAIDGEVAPGTALDINEALTP
jgi:hypothetical protein